MSNMMKKLVVCALVLGLTCGLGFTAVSAAPMQAGPELTSAQQDSIQAQRVQEVARHEQAMLQRANESDSDWKWRQYLEHEQHIQNMQNIQPETGSWNITPVNW